MEHLTNKLNSLLFAFCGIAFAAPCLFFAYYSVRLLYLNLMMEDAAAHRNHGMLIGAIAFPLAVIIFGGMSFFCLRKGWRGFNK